MTAPSLLLVDNTATGSDVVALQGLQLPQQQLLLPSGQRVQKGGLGVTVVGIYLQFT